MLRAWAPFGRLASMTQRSALNGLLLEEHADQLCLVSAPGCAAVIQGHLQPAVPEALSQAALETLAIVVHNQPVTRAEIRAIRGVDSDLAIDTLLARG
jgi:segregation and condensation protein B